MTGWTIRTIRHELDMPTVTAMFAQWEKTPPAALSLLKIQRALYAWAGIKERAPQPIDQQDEVGSLIGDMVPSAPIKILTPEEWLAGVNGNGRAQ